ncbi:MAG: type I methionyl aminopeptidase [Bacteroidetes bacterium]|nr:type I methionyl aminopeptidase [Bacteroidota bacterium]
MAILLKSEEEIEIIRQASKILSKVHGILSKEIKPGITTLYLDKIAEEYIQDHGAKPSFKGFKGYEYSICTSLNEVVVHGLPNKKELKEGDILSIDCGVYFKKYHSDSAYTYPICEVDDEILRFLSSTKESLDVGIDLISTKVRTGDIGNAIQKYIEKRGYSVIRDLVGHGVGHNLHEDPEFPNFGQSGKGTKLRNGMVFAIEPMTAIGKYDLEYCSDKWSIRTKDKSLTAHYEHTIALINENIEVLTTFDYIDNKYQMI